MRKLIVIILLFVVSVNLSAQASGWSFGYRAAIDGYVGDSTSEQEYVALSLFHEPFPSMIVRPSFHVGALLPTRWTDDHGALLTAGVGSALFAIHDHPFNRFLRRESAIIPRIDAQVMIAATSWQLLGASVLLQPFSLHFGDVYVALMGVHLLYDCTQYSWDWGLRIFEISHYLW